LRESAIIMLHCYCIRNCKLSVKTLMY